MFAYKKALEALARGRVPIIIPNDGGVILYEIKPGRMFASRDQAVRERAHCIMAREAHKRLSVEDRSNFEED